MRDWRLFAAFVPLWLGLCLAVSAPALADDPRDPTMTPEAIARDRETIRRMNLDQLAYVRQRDAGYAKGWNDYAQARGRSGQRDHDERDPEDAAENRATSPQAEYAQAMRQWREDVRACRDGYYEYCARR